MTDEPVSNEQPNDETHPRGVLELHVEGTIGRGPNAPDPCAFCGDPAGDGEDLKAHMFTVHGATDGGYEIEVHDLKCWSIYYGPIARGVQHGDLRVEDRNFGAGDLVLLREWSPNLGEFTGAATLLRIIAVRRFEPFEGAELPPPIAALGHHKPGEPSVVLLEYRHVTMRPAL